MLFMIHLVMECRSAADQSCMLWPQSTGSLVLIHAHFLVCTNLSTADQCC